MLWLRRNRFPGSQTAVRRGAARGRRRVHALHDLRGPRSVSVPHTSVGGSRPRPDLRARSPRVGRLGWEHRDPVHQRLRIAPGERRRVGGTSPKAPPRNRTSNMDAGWAANAAIARSTIASESSRRHRCPGHPRRRPEAAPADRRLTQYFDPQVDSPIPSPRGPRQGSPGGLLVVAGPHPLHPRRMSAHRWLLPKLSASPRGASRIASRIPRMAAPRRSGSTEADPDTTVARRVARSPGGWPPRSSPPPGSRRTALGSRRGTRLRPGRPRHELNADELVDGEPDRPHEPAVPAPRAVPPTPTDRVSPDMSATVWSQRDRRPHPTSRPCPR